MLAINSCYLYLLGSVTLRPRQVVTDERAERATIYSINKTFLMLNFLYGQLQSLSLILSR
jgi:hypothetical protein